MGDSMTKYYMRFFFDWGSGTCLWANSEETKEIYDYAVDFELLPISDGLKESLENVINWHDEALNWNDPAGDLLWNQEKIDEFVATAKEVYHKLCNELGSDYEIVYEDKLII